MVIYVSCFVSEGWDIKVINYICYYKEDWIIFIWIIVDMSYSFYMLVSCVVMICWFV